MAIKKGSQAKLMLLILLSLTLLSVGGCNEARVASYKEGLPISIIPHDNAQMSKTIQMIKDNTVFFEMNGKCFGCVFVTTHGPRVVPTIFEVSCDGLKE